MSLLNLTHRQQQQEMLDLPGIPPNDVHDALVELAGLNKLAGVSKTLWGEIKRWSKTNAQHSLRVLDIGCGGGDILGGLAKAAIRQGYQFYGLGIDINRDSLDFARQHSKFPSNVLEFTQGSALSSIPPGFNVIISTLFLHHLSQPQVVQLLNKMYSASEGLVLVHDLIRSRAGYLLTCIATQVFSRKQIIRIDGLRSVEGAFSFDELGTIAEQAGIKNFQLKHTWPCRMLLSCGK